MIPLQDFTVWLKFLPDAFFLFSEYANTSKTPAYDGIKMERTVVTGSEILNTGRKPILYQSFLSSKLSQCFANPEASKFTERGRL
jgi:hypothetical protein